MNITSGDYDADSCNDSHDNDDNDDNDEDEDNDDDEDAENNVDDDVDDDDDDDDDDERLSAPPLRSPWPGANWFPASSISSSTLPAAS